MLLPHKTADVIAWIKRFDTCSARFKDILVQMSDNNLEEIQLNSIKADNYLHFIETWTRSVLEKLEVENARRIAVEKRKEKIAKKKTDK